MNYNTINFIKKSLDYYDNQLEENKQYLENTKFTFKISREGQLTQYQYTILKDNKIIKKGNYQLLGYFDYQTKIFINAWSLMAPNTEAYNSLSRQLFDHVYNMQQRITVTDYDEEQNNMLQYIHNQLNNSRILIEDSIELEIYLATISSLLKQRIDFIHYEKIFLNTDETKYIIKYYFIINDKNLLL